MRWMIYMSAMFLALGLSACGQEEAPAPEIAAPAAESATSDAPAAEAKSGAGGGGYEPAEDERVPGITVSKEELEKQLSEAQANTPQPEIPGEEAKTE